MGFFLNPNLVLTCQITLPSHFYILPRSYPWAYYCKQNDFSDITWQTFLKNVMKQERQTLRCEIGMPVAYRFTNCFPEFASQQFSLTLKISQGQRMLSSPSKQFHLQQESGIVCISRHQTNKAKLIRGDLELNLFQMILLSPQGKKHLVYQSHISQLCM